MLLVPGEHPAGEHPDLVAAGLANIESKKPMTTDAIFWIASMTKPITGTAVMMAAEQGLLSVDDPVSMLLTDD